MDAASRTPDGTWTAPAVLTASQAGGSVDVAIDGAGDVVGIT